MSNEELIAKYEKEISDNEEKLTDDSLSSIEKEMIRSKIRSLNLNITAMKMQENKYDCIFTYREINDIIIGENK